MYRRFLRIKLKQSKPPKRIKEQANGLSERERHRGGQGRGRDLDEFGCGVGGDNNNQYQYQYISCFFVVFVFVFVILRDTARLFALSFLFLYFVIYF